MLRVNVRRPGSHTLRHSCVQRLVDAGFDLKAIGTRSACCSCSSPGIALEDLTFDRVQRFLRHLEDGRGNGIPTRNQRLAALHTFFEYVAGRAPEMFAVCQQIAAIPTKRTPPPPTQFLEHDEIAALFARLMSCGPCPNGVALRSCCAVHACVGARVTPKCTTRFAFTSTMKNAKMGRNQTS